MFKKLIANLPFNPSLIHQVGFYSDRLRGEKSIRRISLLFMVMAMIVQTVAVISPPEKSLAASNNHIINGLKTRKDIIDAWDQSGSDIPAIYGRFGLTRDDILALPADPNVTIKTNDGNDYWSIGRTSLGSITGVKKTYVDSQVPVQYAGRETPATADDQFVYYRQLKAWDIKNPYNSYKAFKGTIAKTGETFWILVDCGNFTKIGKFNEPNPGLDIRKTIENPNNLQSLKPGDSFTFRFEYRNTVPDSVAKDVYIDDTFDLKNFDIVSPTNLPLNGSYMKYDVGNLPYSANYQVLKITVRLKNPLESGIEVCNATRLIASNAPPSWGGPACVKVINPCIYDATKPSNSPDCITPKVVCSVVDSIVDRVTRTVTYKTTLVSSNPATTTVYDYSYDFGDGSPALVQTSAALTDTASHVYAAGSYTAKVVVTYGAEGLNGKQKTDTCNAPIDFDKPFGESKTVKNITQKLEGTAALNSKVKAGDVLEYTLTTTNSQNYERKDITISDYIGDVLDYSTLDTEGLKQTGGEFDKQKLKISWTGITIPANASIDKVFRVTMKNPIPGTNSPSIVSTDSDCKISDHYGNDLTLSVQCPAVKGIESIPNTGPGSSLLMGTTLVAVVGYFFARSRLLSKELDLIRNDYAITGGM